MSFPTGSGKSLCYSVVIVVRPLIVLMMNQVRALVNATYALSM